jgi:hypothetical protein
VAPGYERVFPQRHKDWLDGPLKEDAKGSHGRFLVDEKRGTTENSATVHKGGKMKWRVSLAAWTALSVALLAQQVQAGQPSDPPYFPNGPYEITVDVSPPGLESFTLTGIAVDDDPGDTIVQMTATGAYFLRFSFTPGNPAHFAYSGVDLTENEIGTVVLTIAAFSDPPQTFFVGGTTLTLHIIPEPTIGLAGFAAVWLARGRRR